ncbi:MAG: HU family DNA-binding protein [Prevotellaceae bacterium]|jgi:nucleoid DNA-binding protein/LysM repeat protein|nr:HU family DNA-binding protein [Prevotellaceae bacterium]
MNEKLSIQQLVKLFVDRHNLPQAEAEAFVHAFFSLIEKALDADRYVKVKGLGTFKLIEVESRESINVNTGQRFEIGEHTKVSFTPDAALRDLINKPFAQFETVLLEEGTVLDDTPAESDDSGEQEAVSLPGPDETPVEEPVSSSQPDETPVQEPVSSSQPDETPVEPEAPKRLTPEEKERRVTMNYFIGIVVFVVLLCAAGIAFIYDPDFYNYLSPAKPAPQKVEPVAQAPGQTAVPADTLAPGDTTQVISPDTLEASPLAQTTPVPAKETVTTPAPIPLRATENTAPQDAPYRIDSTSYRIIGTMAKHKIANGETLTRIALKYYGTKAPWPYIVKHNPKTIKNPNSVPLGTTINIPTLVKKE